MRFFGTLVILSVLVLLLSSNPLQAAADPSISGRLIFENIGFSCDHQCVVTLLVSGVRPVQTVFADFGGNFTFTNVPRGLYTVRVEIQGFEPVEQTIEARDAALGLNVVVPLMRKGAAPTGRPEVVNVSQFLDRYPKKAVSLFQKGSEALKRKKQDEAVKYFKDAVDLAPTFYEAHHQLGIAYKETGRLDDAEREFWTAHELNSASAAPLINLTSLYLDQNEFDRAVKTGEEAVKLNSHSAAAFFGLGFALYKTDQLDGAETALKRALDLDSKNGNARLMLANVYLKLHRYDSALEQLNRYIFANPQGQQLQAAIEMRNRLKQATDAEAEAADAP